MAMCVRTSGFGGSNFNQPPSPQVIGGQSLEDHLSLSLSCHQTWLAKKSRTKRKFEWENHRTIAGGFSMASHI